MARKFLCDICNEDVNESQPKTIGEVDACDACAELYDWGTCNKENLKALITSIKMRKSRLGVPKVKKE
jgi:hypothetical protein